MEARRVIIMDRALFRIDIRSDSARFSPTPPEDEFDQVTPLQHFIRRNNPFSSYVLCSTPVQYMSLSGHEASDKNGVRLPAREIVFFLFWLSRDCQYYSLQIKSRRSQIRKELLNQTEPKQAGKLLCHYLFDTCLYHSRAATLIA